MYIKAIKIVNSALCKTTSFKSIKSFDFVTANPFVEGYVILMQGQLEAETMIEILSFC